MSGVDMKFPKQRKPRGIKKDGTRSIDFCDGCFKPGCDPFGGSELYRKKIEGRLDKGLCPACGHMPCKCKSTSLSYEGHKDREKRIKEIGERNKKMKESGR